MGGFMINGMGAADSFYLLKTLHGHVCRSCGKKDYALMEVKRKIRLLYIPTVSINTKYGVVCPKCKNGYYISEEQKDYILRNDPSCVEVGYDGVTIYGMRDHAVIDAPDSDFAALEDASSVPQNMCQCGAVLSPNARFCIKCGMQVTVNSVETENIEHTHPVMLPEDAYVMDDIQDSYPERGEEPVLQFKTCRCGASAALSALYCNHCGEKLVEEPDSEEDTLGKVTETVLEPSDSHQKDSLPLLDRMKETTYVYSRGKRCPECGMRAVSGRDRCGICGTELV